MVPRRKFRDLVAETLSPEAITRSDALATASARIERVRDMSSCSNADIAALTDAELAKVMSDTRRALKLMSGSVDMPVAATRYYLDRLAQEALKRPAP